MSQVHQTGLLDTNVVILLSRIPTELRPARIVVSVVTVAELTVGPLIAQDEQERARRQAHIDVAQRAFHPLPFDQETATAYGSVAAAMRRAGRKSLARSLDAMIAATAVAHDLPLYTCDPADFAGIEGLQVVAVPHPDRN